jgi:hypothetical protein
MARETRESSFDELARGLASGTVSRRKALQLMGAALVGGTLGSLGGVAAADEECKPNGKKCRKDKQCCSGNCEGRKCAAAACTSNGGTCTSGSQCCSGNCKSGMCVESCIPPNAIPCDLSNPTAACGPNVPGACFCGAEASSQAAYCLQGVTGIPCTTSCDCPTGQFCHAPNGTAFCVSVCSPS